MIELPFFYFRSKDEIIEIITTENNIIIIPNNLRYLTFEENRKK